MRPEARERADGVDQDCDGSVDEAVPAELAPWFTWEGTDRNDRAGAWTLLAWDDALTLDIDAGTGPIHAGDVDGDGLDDLVAPMENGVAVAFGPWVAGAWDFQGGPGATVETNTPTSVTAVVDGAWLLVGLPWMDDATGAVFAIPAESLLGSLTLEAATIRVPRSYGAAGTFSTQFSIFRPA